MIRMYATLLAIAVVTASPAVDQADALSHRQTLPVTAIPYTYYLTTAGVPAEKRAQLEIGMRFILPSLSMKPLVDEQIPQQLTDTLYFIDTRNYGWERSLPKVLKDYPYAVYGYPSLVIRADWFLPFATDCSENGAYYDLLFGQRFKTRDEFTKFLKIENDRKYAFGLIEGESGVAVQKVRWMESRPIPRGYAWVTRDSEKITFDSDPLEHPAGDFKHDAEEWIVGVPKLSSATGKRGALQLYFLSSGQGQTQDEAPIKIVQDHTKIRYGSEEIRNGISCIACHTTGLNLPTVNEFRSLIEEGADIYAKKGVQQQLEAFHLSDINKELTRNNEDFQDIVEHCTGVSSEQAAKAYFNCVQDYDAPLSILHAALEVGCTPKELQLAIAYASNDGKSTARDVRLAQGKQGIPRHTWEDGGYIRTYYAVKAWRGK